jgi:conjugative transfer region protein TrbK
MEIGTPQVLKVIALGLGIAAGLAALLELSSSAGRDRLTPAVAEDPHGAALDRCRNLDPADYARATDCRAAWEAARQRFLGLPPGTGPATPPSPGVPSPTAPSPDTRPDADPAGTE